MRISLVFVWWLASTALPATQAADHNFSQATCDPRLAALFAPPRPQLGRYDVCTSPLPLDSVAAANWPREFTNALDALGSAGTYDRAAVARLYGSQRPAVAHGWVHHERLFESVTLVSPYPDSTLTHLEPGTLIIRLIICCP